MKMTRLLALCLAAASLPACSSLGSGESGISEYRFVPVKRIAVGSGAMTVSTPRPWNRLRGSLFRDIREVEDWTLNGPFLDGISFVTGLKSGRYIIYQRKCRKMLHVVPPQPIICRTQAASGASGFMLRYLANAIFASPERPCFISEMPCQRQASAGASG